MLCAFGSTRPHGCSWRHKISSWDASVHVIRLSFSCMCMHGIPWSSSFTCTHIRMTYSPFQSVWDALGFCSGDVLFYYGKPLTYKLQNLLQLSAPSWALHVTEQVLTASVDIMHVFCCYLCPGHQLILFVDKQPNSDLQTQVYWVCHSDRHMIGNASRLDACLDLVRQDIADPVSRSLHYLPHRVGCNGVGGFLLSLCLTLVIANFSFIQPEFSWHCWGWPTCQCYNSGVIWNIYSCSENKMLCLAETFPPRLHHCAYCDDISFLMKAFALAVALCFSSLNANSHEICFNICIMQHQGACYTMILPCQVAYM